jgi:acyl dehydratase
MAEREVFFEDVDVADEIPPLPFRLTKEQVRHYAALCGLAEMGRFTDEEEARKEGHRTIVAPGNMVLGLLSRVLTEWAWNGTLRKIEANLRDFVQPDEDLTSYGIVTAKHIRAGENLVECDVYIENGDGEKLATGTAVMALPSRS